MLYIILYNIDALGPTKSVLINKVSQIRLCTNGHFRMLTKCVNYAGCLFSVHVHVKKVPL